MALWGDEETLKLIEVWGQDNIQAQLEGCKRNTQVFAKIASEMRDAAHWYERIRDQCQDKIKKLKGEYRKIIDKHGKTGEGKKGGSFLKHCTALLLIGRQHAPLIQSTPLCNLTGLILMKVISLTTVTLIEE